jgi:uncharacterized protein YdcH (DUF465 family)
MNVKSKTAQELIKNNFEFKQLYKEHETLEVQINTISKKKHISSDDEIHRKELQKKKLVGKDRMEQILRQAEG